MVCSQQMDPVIRGDFEILTGSQEAEGLQKKNNNNKGSLFCLVFFSRHDLGSSSAIILARARKEAGFTVESLLAFFLLWNK